MNRRTFVLSSICIRLVAIVSATFAMDTNAQMPESRPLVTGFNSYSSIEQAKSRFPTFSWKMEQLRRGNIPIITFDAENALIEIGQEILVEPKLIFYSIPDRDPFLANVVLRGKREAKDVMTRKRKEVIESLLKRYGSPVLQSAGTYIGVTAVEIHVFADSDKWVIFYYPATDDTVSLLTWEVFYQDKRLQSDSNPPLANAHLKIK